MSWSPTLRTLEKVAALTLVAAGVFGVIAIGFGLGHIALAGGEMSRDSYIADAIVMVAGIMVCFSVWVALRKAEE
jgi:hypothetical protein